MADAIIHAAEYGDRDYYIRGGGKLMSTLNKHVPSAIDWMGSMMGAMDSFGPPNRPRDGSLHAVAKDGQVHGEPTSMVRSSLYTKAQSHPLDTAALLTLASAAVLAMSFNAKRS